MESIIHYPDSIMLLSHLQYIIIILQHWAILIYRVLHFFRNVEAISLMVFGCWMGGEVPGFLYLPHKTTCFKIPIYNDFNRYRSKYETNSKQGKWEHQNTKPSPRQLDTVLQVATGVCGRPFVSVGHFYLWSTEI